MKPLSIKNFDDLSSSRRRLLSPLRPILKLQDPARGAAQMCRVGFRER